MARKNVPHPRNMDKSEDFTTLQFCYPTDYVHVRTMFWVLEGLLAVVPDDEFEEYWKDPFPFDILPYLHNHFAVEVVLLL